MKDLEKSILESQKDWNDRIHELTSNNVKGVVFYSDGGARSIQFKNRAGFGIHAYFYNDEKPKGIGSYKLEYPTATRYKLKKECAKDDIVNVFQLLNCYGYIGDKTSPVSEITAFLVAAKIFLISGMDKITSTFILRTDSEYVTEGINKFIDSWASNNWRKADGSSLKNVTYWKEVYDVLREFQDRDIGWDVGWVKGHANNYGNIIADQMATLGLFQDNPYNDQWINRDEYMGLGIDLCPLMLDSKLLAYPQKLNKRDGMFYHYIYTNSNNLDKTHDIGRNLIDASIGIVGVMHEPWQLNNVYDRCDNLGKKYGQYPKVVDLNAVSKMDIQEEFSEDNVNYLPLSNEMKSKLVKSTSERTLVTILDPPRNALFTAANLENLYEIYRRLVSGEDETIIETDITDVLFEGVENGKGVIKYQFTKREAQSVTVAAPLYKQDGVVTFDIPLTFGLDLPRSRVFSNIKDLNPRVSVFTWYENEYISYFGTIVRIDNAFGIWCAEVSNTILTGELKP